MREPNYGYSKEETKPWMLNPFQSANYARAWSFEYADGPVSTLVQFGGYCGINPITIQHGSWVNPEDFQN